MTKVFLICLTLLILSGCNRGTVELSTNGPKEIQSDLMKMRELLEVRDYWHKTIPGISNMTDYQKSKAVREFIYSNVKLESTKQPFPFHKVLDGFRMTMDKKETGHICGGLTWLYIVSMESLGVPARYVGIFSSNDSEAKNYSNHASSEVFINGKWVISDPTFNNEILDSTGNPIGWFELADYLKAGNPYTVKYGEKTIESRKLENYYISLKDITKYLITSPVRVGQSLYKIQKFPSEWNGKILGKKVEDMKMFVKFEYYKFIGKGYLR